MEITLRRAEELVACFGGHDAEVSIMERPDAWIDMAPGLYAYFTEYSEVAAMDHELLSEIRCGVILA